MSYVETMSEKKQRKKEKIVRMLKAGDKGEVNRNSNGNILPVKLHYKKLPKETPPGRDSKLFEHCEGSE